MARHHKHRPSELGKRLALLEADADALELRVEALEALLAPEPEDPPLDPPGDPSDPSEP